jgi:surface antigen
MTEIERRAIHGALAVIRSSDAGVPMSAQRHRSATPASQAEAPAVEAPSRRAASARGGDVAAPAADTLAALLGGAGPRGEVDERSAAPSAPPTDGMGGGSTSGNWGKETGSYQGVKVFSNGPDKTTTKRGTYGLMYQCVEFVNRFSVEASGTGNMIGTGNAVDYAGDSRKNFGYTWVPNHGQDRLPSPGDILVFGGGQFGHVAIATGGDVNGIRMVQQNTSSATGTLSVDAQGGSYKIKNWGSHNVLGWQTLGDSASEPKAPTPPAPAVTPTPTVPHVPLQI